MKDGILIVCPKCAGLVFIPSSLKGQNVLDLLRSRRAQKEGGMDVTAGDSEDPDQIPLIEAPPAETRAS